MADHSRDRLDGAHPAFLDVRIRPPLRDTAAEPPVVLADEMRRYDELYAMAALSNLTFEDLVDEMERFAVRGIMHAEHETGASRDWNQRVAELVARRPDLFVGGVASVDPRQPDALEELVWAHEELGLRGLVLQPGFLGLYPTDPVCEPLYAFCAQRGLPVALHTGVNFSLSGTVDFGRPVHVDKVACAFPELTLICNHGGWPWVMESIAVAWKHANVYLEFGGVAPKYLVHPSAGWQPLTHWMNTQLRDKVFLGTDWPMLQYGRLAAELPQLELRPEAEANYIGGNARRILEPVWAKGEALA